MEGGANPANPGVSNPDSSKVVKPLAAPFPRPPVDGQGTTNKIRRLLAKT